MKPLDTLGAEYRQWQQERRNGIGGSDVAGILGLSKWASPYSVWADKVLDQRDETPEQRERWDAGHDAEHYLALQFQRHHPGLYVGAEQYRLSNDKPWAFAHVDGLIFDGCYEDAEVVGPWDAKTVNDYTPWDEVPPYYVAQMQWAMWLGAYEVAWITAGFSGWKTRTYEIERDQGDIDLIVAECERFWTEHVVTGIPPEVDDSDATSKAIAAHHPEHIEGERAEVSELDVARWVTAKQNEADAKRRKTEAQNRIAAALGDAEIGTAGDTALVTYRSQTRTTTCEACGHESTSKPFRVLRPASNRED